MNEFEDRMAALRGRFTERCPSDAAALRQAWTDRDHAELRRILHGLAGSAGVFGYSELSASAREIEDALDSEAEEAIEARLRALLLNLEAIGSSHL